MRPVVLFRKSLAEENEFEICSKYLNTVESRVGIRDSLVIGRYSTLPYYKELEEDLKKQGSKLINTYQQYNYLANINEWYEDFADLTFKTWFSIPDINEPGPYVLKGNTNSRKQFFKTHMYAENKQEAIQVMLRLQEDTLLSHQGIVIRKFEPLISYGKDLSGIDISKEFCFFVLYGQVISGGYYWSQHYDDLEVKPSIEEVPVSLLDDVLSRVGDKASFWSVDIAQTVPGAFKVVEIGDGQMSGLSMNSPEMLYAKIKEVLGGYRE